ncbi:Ig-like domain-containing protein [Streptomyces sp. AM 4-1-1]|uniref:L,D-transpeptidase n=1 Tax=unclassified Streptomyces TaxID=2593676 RepID=UPI0023BA0130|nr:Ig-like domain-containing protein [Streptomyces sp. AM 4-1-1]WEH35992.1 Ig-like domain-containing protein [Streptomyces sp. AM 4-1-1]
MNGQPISGASVGAHGGRRGRRAAGLSALVLSALLLATGCGGGASGSGGDGKGGGTKVEDTAASRAVVTITPKDGADSVATSGALKISAEQGKLTTVKVADPKGQEVEGAIAADGASWAPERHLAAATKYTVHVIAKDTDGRQSAKDTTFTTLVPKNTFVGQYTPEDGSTVGVGMPVSIHFTRGITDPDAVEKAIKVTAVPAVPIEGHWFGNDRLDFRPQNYWAAGTKVTVRIGLDGVEGRPGVYGKQTRTVNFTVGRSQVSTVDAASHRMKVVRDGKEIKDIAISAGAPATTTYNGQMVISEKLKVTRMNGDTVGFGGEYDIKDVPHAMRLSTSGTFIHGNYWGGSGVFGSANTSHGCVGLRDVRGAGDGSTPAAWFFDNSLIGDVVVVKNSKDKVIQPDNGLNGWNMPWSEWTR